MRFTGNIAGIHRNIGSGKLNVLFSVNENDREVLKGYDLLHDKLLTVEAKRYRKKRSLNANNYAWKLISEMADIQGTSKEEMYEIMLERYGATEVQDDKAVIITVRPYVDMTTIEGHYAKVGRGYIGDKEYISYRVIKGSSKYNTLEMSRFIDGIIGECKEMDIDTITPAEIQEMKERWGVEISNSR